MKDKVKKLFLLGGVVLSMSVTSCDNQATIKPVDFSNGLNFKIRYCKQVVGEGAKTDTITKYQVGANDEGFPCYDSTRDRYYMFFGDTFLYGNQTGKWRSNVMAWSDDKDLSDGLDIKGWHQDYEDGPASPIIDGLHQDKYEETKIPTGSICIDGTIYMFYFSKVSWDNAVPPAQSMNYGGCVKSTDGGVTFERVPDLTWVDHVEDDPNKPMQQSVDNIEALIDLDVKGRIGSYNIDMKHHEGYRFTQNYPLDGKDGYIYIFGQGGFRTSYVSLARVKKENIEKFDEYEYLVDYDKNKEPVWLKGREGLDKLHKYDFFGEAGDKGYCYCYKGWEMSVTWNAYLGKWCFFMPCSWDGLGIYMGVADKPYGPYSKQNYKIIDCKDPIFLEPNIYAPMCLEQWQEQNGKVFYMFVSCWKPVYTPHLLRIEMSPK